MTKDEATKTLARNLRVALSLRNMKPFELSRKTNISRANISRIVNGKHTASAYYLFLIAKELNYPMQDFYAQSISVFGGDDGK